ncbi:MAG: family 78 glycoside hydrolase catalytic domain [Victivallaceae bacterium]|nr:family 78 glycoside hydrolase catalytic domain [Victivallaceae bacterium]
MKTESLSRFGVTSEHEFSGKWITAGEFLQLPHWNVFHRQLDAEARRRIENRVRNRHILFRRKFSLAEIPEDAVIYFSADDYCKIYLNGAFVAQGPTPGYVSHYHYQSVDVRKFLRQGENTLAVHTYYQGLINRVWVSGDNRHGLLLDLESGRKNLLASGEDFRCHVHSAYSDVGISGYDTQFMERYDAGAAEVGFETPLFDDSNWAMARMVPHAEYQLYPARLPALVFERIAPKLVQWRAPNRLFVDFGAMYVGVPELCASGRRGDAVEMRFGQELEPDGSVRYHLRANCVYQEYFLLSGKKSDRLEHFDYLSFRYAEFILPEDGSVSLDCHSIALTARHMPFELAAKCRFEDEASRRIWELCVRTIHYGVQEQIQDCMEREKGYYLGDGCYTMMTWCLLIGDVSPIEKFIDDFLRTDSINGGLMTCGNCSFMQEIAEYPLMMFLLLRFYLVQGGSCDFVRERLGKFRSVLDFYRENYAQGSGMLANLDKWCVVEWPQNMRDGYDAEITEGRVCTETHNAINAWYVGAIRCFNRTARMLGEEEYPGEAALIQAFQETFYDPEKKLFRDSATSSHCSLAANVFAWFFELPGEEQCRKNILAMVREKRLTQSLLFVTFPMFAALCRDGEEALMHDLLTDDGAWLRMLREGATSTFEGWGKETKWNTSLFHLTLSYAAVFMTPWPLRETFSFR